MRVLTVAWQPAADGAAPVDGRAGVDGTGYDLVHAHLCAALAALGHDARPLVARRLTRASALVRQAQRDGADVVVVRASPADAGAAAALAAAVAAAGHRDRVPRLACEWLPRFPYGPPARVGADGPLRPDAGSGAARDGVPHRSLVALAEAIGVGVTPEALRSSPWESGTVPARHAHRLGLLTDDPACPGRLRDPELVVRELRFLAARPGVAGVVPLVGFATRDVPSSGELWSALRAAGPAARLSVEVDVTGLDRAGVRLLAAAGVVSLRLRVVVGEAPVPTGAVRRAMVAASAHVGELAVVAEPAPGCPHGALVDAGAALAAVAPGLTWRNGPARRDGPVHRPVRTVRPRTVRTGPSRPAAPRTGVDPDGLARVVSGRYPAVVRAGVVDIWWECRQPPARYARWLDAVAGGGTHLWVVDPSHVEPAPPVLGPVHVVSRTDRPGTPGRTLWLPYREGRHYTGLRPAVLALDEGSRGGASTGAWLADADAARRHGRFRPGFLNPMTVLQDAVVWTSPGAAPVRRLVVGPEGEIRTSFGGRPVAHLADGPEATLAALRDPASVRDPEIEGHHRDRPWLATYLAVRDALKAVCGTRADRLSPRAWRPARVSGFGGPLLLRDVGDGTFRPDPAVRHPGICLLAVAGGYYLYGAASGRVVEVSATVAAVAEALLSDPESAVDVLGALTRKPRSRIERAVDSVSRTLQELRGAASA